MPTCVECKLVVPKLLDLKLHLVIVHKRNMSLEFKCMEEGCFRVLSNWKNFRRHFNRSHSCLVTKEQPPDNLLSCDNDIECSNVNVSSNNSEECAPDESRTISLKDVRRELSKVLFLFLCKLYAAPSLPRSHVQEVFDNLEEMFSSYFSLVSHGIRSELVRAGLSDEISDTILGFLQCWKEPFSVCRSEYLRLKTINSSGFMIHPETFTVGFLAGEKRKRKLLIKDMILYTAQFVRLRKTLKVIFELPNVLNQTLAYMNQLAHELANGIISNVIQGHLWPQKVAAHFQDKIVIPLSIFYDDFEVKDPLGTHNCIQKLGGVYFNVPTFPPEFRSKIENIFLTLLFHSSDRSIFKNVSVFQKLIDELNFLQTEGIMVQTGAGVKRIFFSLAHFSGDNLGLNGALGFVKSFRSNYFCRICKVKKCLTQKDARERAFLVRSPEDYQRDVELGYEQTGIKESSVWNKVEHFHTVSNFVVDVFHDLLLGVLRYDVGRILHYFVFKLMPEDDRLQLDLLTRSLRHGMPAFHSYFSVLATWYAAIPYANLTLKFSCAAEV